MATWQCPVCTRVHASPSSANAGGCEVCAPGGVPSPERVTSGSDQAVRIDAPTLNLLRWARGALIVLGFIGAIVGGVFTVLTLASGHPWLALLQGGATVVSLIITAANAALIRVVLELEWRTRAAPA